MFSLISTATEQYMRLNKIKILFNRVEARLDFSQNCGIMSVWQSAQLPGGQDSLFCVSV